MGRKFIEFTITVEFKRSQQNKIADCLSRLYATEDDLLAYTSAMYEMGYMGIGSELCMGIIYKYVIIMMFKYMIK